VLLAVVQLIAKPQQCNRDLMQAEEASNQHRHFVFRSRRVTIDWAALHNLSTSDLVCSFDCHVGQAKSCMFKAYDCTLLPLPMHSANDVLSQMSNFNQEHAS